MKECRDGIAAAGRALASEAVLQRTFFFVPRDRRRSTVQAAYLLPNYDECLIAYKDRGSVVETQASPRVTDVFGHHVLMGDQVIGSWRRNAPRRIEVTVHRRISREETRAIQQAGRAYSDFVESAVSISVVRSSTAGGAG
jgi:hypothetical protein